MEVFFQSLVQVLAWPAVGLMALGAFIGFWVGILPGVGGAVTLALMIPFVYTMDPVGAFAFLLGMHAVCAMCGDVTAVLFAIPGENSSTPCILDGFPMSQKGQAGRALGAILTSSLIGAWVGALFLAIAIPFIRPIVLSFGSSEFLMLSLLGISFVVSLSGKNLLKGLLMAGIGFFLATMGIDPQMGIPRFTFGQLWLWQGASIVAVTVGIFAIPEILEMMFSGHSIAKSGSANIAWSGVWEGVLDTLRHWVLVIRCSIIGVFLGIIPGMGSGVATWIAYAHAQQTSKNPETFGTGRVEGLLAVGAGQNSKEGGSLVSAVAFGIPGGPAMALLLAAFLVVGLAPGPAMLTTHLNVTFSMVWTVVIAHLMAVGFVLISVRWLNNLTFLNGRVLAPSLLVLSALGTYAESGSIYPVALMFLMGGVGVLAVRYHWPRPPLVLAAVLGDTIEKNLWLSYNLSQWAWLQRPGVLAILVIILAGLILPSVYAHLNRRRTAAATRLPVGN